MNRMVKKVMKDLKRLEDDLLEIKTERREALEIIVNNRSAILDKRCEIVSLDEAITRYLGKIPLLDKQIEDIQAELCHTNVQLQAERNEVKDVKKFDRLSLKKERIQEELRKIEAILREEE